MSSSAGSTPRGASPEPLLSNSSDDSAPWVIQKYGGTSVGKSLASIGAIVESYIPNSKVAVVCSARSGTTKALGTTNLLLQASREALNPPTPSVDGNAEATSGAATPFYPKRVGSGYFNNGNGVSMTPTESGLNASISSLRDLKMSRSSSPSPFQPSTSSPSSSGFLPIATPGINGSSNGYAGSNDLPAFHKTVDQLKKDHLEAARNAIKDPDLLQELIDEIERDLDRLRSFLNAAQIIDEISPRSQDSIVGIGERLACKIVAASLRDRGIDSELVSLENIVDSTIAAGEGSAQASSSHDQGVGQLDQDFYDKLSARLGERLRACGSRVPVITGYFGVVPGSLLSQIGRGYTDLCAALCAVGVQASELQVWKEVDGIFTADPRKVPTARLVPVITPDEAAELTYYGSEVIHPFTMEQVIRAKIPIRIKNVENPIGDGTIIYPAQSEDMEDESTEESASGVGRKDVNEVVKAIDAIKMPTAVTIKDEIIVINIHSNRKTISHGFLARIFGTLDKTGVVVDLISTSEVHVSMALQDFSKKERLERLVRDLEKIGHITVSKDMAILSLVGRQMRHMVGIAGKMFSTLAEGNVNIEMISQGASEINISCVINGRDGVKALNLIHQACLTSPVVASNGGKFKLVLIGSRGLIRPMGIAVNY